MLISHTSALTFSSSWHNNDTIVSQWTTFQCEWQCRDRLDIHTSSNFAKRRNKPLSYWREDDTERLCAYQLQKQNYFGFNFAPKPAFVEVSFSRQWQVRLVAADAANGVGRSRRRILTTWSYSELRLDKDTQAHTHTYACSRLSVGYRASYRVISHKSATGGVRKFWRRTGLRYATTAGYIGNTALSTAAAADVGCAGDEMQ